MILRIAHFYSGVIMNSRSQYTRNLHDHSRLTQGRSPPSQRITGMPTASHKYQDRSFDNSTRNNSHSDKDLVHTTRGQKRRGDSPEVPPDRTKRPRDSPHVRNKSSSSASEHNTKPSSSSNISDNYIVPVSRGTERITMAIWHYFMNHQMSEDDLKKKLLLRKSLLSVLTGAYPNCRLFMVGSSMTGFATKASDVDMCLMITQDEIDQKRDATLILSSIARALRQCSFVRHSQVIRAKVPILKFYDQVSHSQVIRAKVPILKFYDQVSGVECDLNINNLVGIRNTHLLRHYAYMDWRVRPLMLFVKKWARFHDINDASKKTISSYSLTLMLIHYLQAGINPPVLPCLQQLKPEMFSSKTDVRKLSLSLQEKANFTSKNQATLGELFLGFLNYYTYVFSYGTHVISIRKGKCVNRNEVRTLGDSMQWKYLNIEEPFEGSNTARSVYDLHVFTRIMRVFKASYSFLEKSRDLEAILSRPF
ncbi:poly(a) RNA polymerase gld-2-like protein a [Plakobranchus ocellatus]|uniref:Poly(A) RNA polymerase gld-2-like protein a n=1 Tax=Plakobranchus ocellatus TaxID=259542 RepID=A0AAV4CY76_9GAST|nr:poly(a) RNA polymerase gld-2-like protein a [Plakobranchus ocellatus]